MTWRALSDRPYYLQALLLGRAVLRLCDELAVLSDEGGDVGGGGEALCRLRCRLGVATIVDNKTTNWKQLIII
jgi:hypothetical protein